MRHQKIKSALMVLSPLLVLTISVKAEVDPKIHNLCVQAKDYAGCVRAMKGETATETTVNQIQRQGANLTEGNSCPAQHLSSGGGYCQRVVCVKRGLYGRGHAEGLGGKGNSCKGGAELTWDNNHQPVRASLEKRCPPGDFDIGFQNTCQQALIQGRYSGYSLGFSMHKQGVPRSPMTLTENITEVFGTPAKGNLKVGDKVVTINGLRASEFKIDFHKSKAVKVIIERQGKVLEYDLTTEYQTRTIPRSKG